MTTLSDDAQITAVNVEEVEPPCKKPRLQDQPHFMQLKLHTRLIIYDYLDIIHDDDGYIVTNYSSENDWSLAYARMSIVASILGDLDALQYLAGISDNIFIPKNNEGLLNFNLLGEMSFDMECICYHLASNAHWKTLKWAISEQYPHTYYTLAGAVQGGASFEILQWLYSQGCLGDEFAFKMAAERGDSSVMKWLHQIRCPWKENTFAAAVKKCDLDVLRWLKENECPWNENTFVAAVKRGRDFKLLVWLRMEGCPWSSRTFYHALMNGADLFTLQWFLHQDSSLMDHYVFSAGIYRGDMEILELLRTKNCPMTTDHFIYAIERYVPLDMLKWLYHAKCPWNALVFSSALKRGDMVILKWLREKKCPWNSDCYKIALENDSFDIVQWLHEEKCPCDEQQKAALDIVHLRLHQSVLSWYDRSHELTVEGRSLLPEDPEELQNYTTLDLSELVVDLEDSHQLWARQPPITQDIRKFFLPR